MTTGVLAFFIPFVVTIVLGPWVISTLRRLKAGQVIQKEGPESHMSKAGTPAMGGGLIMLGFLAGALAVSVTFRLDEYGGRFLAVVALTVVYMLIGLVDDWLTIKPRNGKRGIGSKPKFLLQLIAAVGFVAYLWASHELNTKLMLQNLHTGGGIVVPSIELGRWLYSALAVLLITGMANFINITDGLDGLAAGLTVPLAGALSLAALVMQPHPRGPEMLFLALAGACLGFLWYNFNPAKVFMGDTGSLAIGAAIPAIAIVTKTEIYMVIAGLVFILDGLSSALQWAVFKYTRIRTGTGRRVFKMSPVHHHFELSGWPEQNVVVRFWIVGFMCALVAVLVAVRLVM